jgi:hypothetical protein
MDHTLSPTERFSKLSALRRPLVDALGELDTYRQSDNNLREADSSSVQEVEWVRQNATIRDELIGLGELTEAVADAMGMLSHAELDRLEEEGLLEEAATGIAERWAEARKSPTSPLPAAAPPAGPSRPGEPEVDPAEQQMKDAANERALGSLTDYVAASSQQAESLASPAIQQAVQENGGELHQFDQRLKSKASIRSKIQRRRDTMPLATDQERAQIPDGARYTAVFPDEGYNQGVERTLGALKSAGFKQLEALNSWTDPDWAGLLVVLRSPSSTSVEVVFQTPEALAAMKANKPILARFRNSDDPHERHELYQQMEDNLKNAPAPKGAEQLGDTSSAAPGPGPDGLPSSGPGSLHSVVGAHELAPGDQAQDPLHGGVVTASGPAKKVASVDAGEDGTTVGWHDGSSSKFQPGSTVKKLRS